jgi:hypothetical protein
MPVLKGRFGFFSLLGTTNKLVVQRTWGLKEMQSKQAAYGPEFAYDEFLSAHNRILAMFIGGTSVLFIGAMALLKPVRQSFVL